MTFRIDDPKWYCPCCEGFLYDDEVTGLDENDPKCLECHVPCQSKPDPDDKGYDTLEEKHGLG